MRKIFMSLAVMAVVAASLMSCNKKEASAKDSPATFTSNKLQVTGEMTDMPDTLFVITPESYEQDRMDTIVVKDGKFEYTLLTDSVTRLLILDDKAFTRQDDAVVIELPAVPGEQLTLGGSAKDRNQTITGSKYYKEYGELYAALTKVTDENENDDAKTIDAIFDFAKKHPKYECDIELLQPVSGLAPERFDEFLKLIDDGVKNGRMKKYYDNLVTECREAIEAEKESDAKHTGGMEVPDFTLIDRNGQPLSLSSLRGKYVVIDFWGSWCSWCIKGLPRMKEYYAKYKSKMEILSVDCNDSPEAWQAAIREHGMIWKNVYCPQDNDLPQRLGVTGFPTKIVLDPQGKIMKAFAGETEDFYTFLDATLK